MKQGILYAAAAVLMAVLVFAGCSGPFDREAVTDLDQRGLAVTQSSAAGAQPNGRGNAVKMVPFRGSGTYQYVDFIPDFELQQIEIVVALEGTLTHLGRFRAVERYHFEFIIMEDALVPTAYLSHSATYTAANGDELYIEGSGELGSELVWYSDDTGIGFSLTGVWIAGGTGRFGNAEGWFDLWINRSADPEATGGIWELGGEISSAGSSK